MAGIQDYAPVAADNTALFPEGMAPSAVNDGMRQVQADLRAWYNDAEWVQYGDGEGPATIAFASATSFTVAGADVAGEYHAGRRVRVVGSATGTIYGTISSSSFSTNTTVNVTWDSGELSNEALTMSLAILRAANRSYPIVSAVEHKFLTKTAAYTALAADRGKLLDFTTAGVTLSLTAAATLGDGWFCVVRNSALSGNLTIDPNSSETIDGGTTLVLAPSQAVAVYCNGTLFRTVGLDLIGDINSLASNLNSDGSIDPAADLIPIYDASGAVVKKVQPNYLLGLGLPTTTGVPVDSDMLAVINSTTLRKRRFSEIFDRSTSANGYLRLPGNGIIVQWGKTNVGAGDTATGSPLNVTYPNAHLQAYGQGTQGDDNNVIVAPNSVSTIALGNPSSFAQDIRWLSIGW